KHSSSTGVVCLTQRRIPSSLRAAPSATICYAISLEELSAGRSSGISCFSLQVIKALANTPWRQQRHTRRRRQRLPAILPLSNRRQALPQSPCASLLSPQD